MAQILSAALMLHESFELSDEARCIETAVDNVLAAGRRTADIVGHGSDVLGTRRLAECIAEEAAELASETRKIA